jgi:spore maturation protein B
MSLLIDSVNLISIFAIPAMILAIVVYGAIRRVKVYEVFVEGAKEAFQVAVRIIPYLVAMLVAIGVFRAGGAMDVLTSLLSPVTSLIGMPSEAVPMAVMRPLSGSGALGVMSETIKVYGPDSFIGRIVSVMMGSAETTFYVLAVYFGSVSISRTRHAVPAGIIADLAAMVASVWVVRLVFG